MTGQLDEIEVTPEMIEARVLLNNYDTRFSNEEDIVEMIPRTMYTLRATKRR